MEMINRIELQGTIGRVEVKQVNDAEVANISVVTNYVYQSQNGMPTVESTWHNVVAWRTASNRQMVVDFSRLVKGGAIHVLGRIRNKKYTKDGKEMSYTEILASEVSVPVPDDLP